MSPIYLYFVFRPFNSNAISNFLKIYRVFIFDTHNAIISLNLTDEIYKQIYDLLVCFINVSCTSDWSWCYVSLNRT
jgi:hypothetical protein